METSSHIYICFLVEVLFDSILFYYAGIWCIYIMLVQVNYENCGSKISPSLHYFLLSTYFIVQRAKYKVDSYERKKQLDNLSTLKRLSIFFKDSLLISDCQMICVLEFHSPSPDIPSLLSMLSPLVTSRTVFFIFVSICVIS